MEPPATPFPILSPSFLQRNGQLLIIGCSRVLSALVAPLNLSRILCLQACDKLLRSTLLWDLGGFAWCAVHAAWSILHWMAIHMLARALTCRMRLPQTSGMPFPMASPAGSVKLEGPPMKPSILFLRARHSAYPMQLHVLLPFAFAAAIPASGVADTHAAALAAVAT